MPPGTPNAYRTRASLDDPEGRSHGGHCPHLLEARPAQRPVNSAYFAKVPAPFLQDPCAFPSQFPSQFDLSSAAMPTMGLWIGE